MGRRALMLATAGLGQAYVGRGARVVGVDRELTRTERGAEGRSASAALLGLRRRGADPGCGGHSKRANGRTGGSDGDGGVPSLGAGELRHRCDGDDRQSEGRDRGLSYSAG